jgi:hypothetical protein
MSNSTTATVETLTAEVRVLMLGSRQVTLSVYGQLDCVPHSQIEPFGRVRPKDADRSDIWVVGRPKADGSLVRSRAPYKSEVLNAIGTAAADARVAVAHEGALAFGRLIQAGLLDQHRAKDALVERARKAGLGALGSLTADIREQIRSLNEGSAKPPDGPFESKARLIVDAYEEADLEAEAAVEQVRAAWADLPLIVLAGLR